MFRYLNVCNFIRKRSNRTLSLIMRERKEKDFKISGKRGTEELSLILFINRQLVIFLFSLGLHNGIRSLATHTTINDQGIYRPNLSTR